MTNENVSRKGPKGYGQSQRVPRGWAEAQKGLAASSGFSILLVDGGQPPALAIANDNSICAKFQSSSIHAHLCEPYCGDAFNRAEKAGGTAKYRCHAGLHCVAMRIPETNSRLAVIGGRAFLKTADYRALAERIRAGDLQDMFSAELFNNVVFAAGRDMEDFERHVSDLTGDFKGHSTGKMPVRLHDSPLENESPETTVGTLNSQSMTRPNNTAIDDSCEDAIRALAVQHKLESLALLLRIDNEFVASFVSGRFVSEPALIRVETHAGQIFDAARNRESLLMIESRDCIEMVANVIGSRRGAGKKTLELFPIITDNEVKASLLVTDVHLDSEKRVALSSFCREFAFPLEILRLREELQRRAQFAASLQTFASGVSTGDSEETYSSILTHSTKLLHSERSSLLLYDESTNELTVKAALGPRAKTAIAERIRMGDSIAGSVLQDGRPLVVRDLEESGRKPAPADRRYKTKSFISFPIFMRGRKLGVLNVTDKSDGSTYNEADLHLIETFAPQIALALDRADWQEKAAQFQLISITDPLTGLLNRRYLEERLAEELRRSERENYPMSFLMIDIDDFKFYNDQNGHQAGDLALEMTAQCLKSVLRGADIASRYGGEEFCILLPQTTLDEALAIAERIRQRVEEAPFPHGKTQPHGAVTASIGVSSFDKTRHSAAAIIRSADLALYEAKRRGKNTVCVLNGKGSD